MDSIHPHIAIIILAAGESKRFGSPKQLARIDNKALLQHAIDVALASNAASDVVILGAHEQTIRTTIDFKNTTVVVNTNWREGIASSIRSGIQSVMERADGAVLMVCDQPGVSAELLNRLIERFALGQHSIVASRYGDVFGTPVLFGKEFFPDLLLLHGDSGARIIIEQNLTQTAFVPFPQGALDVDTPSDLQR